MSALPITGGYGYYHCMNRVILHVDMDAFYASVEQHDHPELRGKPVVVGAPPDKRGVVSACSYEARKFGIHSAMPSREAGRKCPHAAFIPPRMRRYEQVSRQIFSIFERFTPLIEPLSLDEAFLDVTSAKRLFGDGPEIGRKIRQAIKTETGLTASVGVAHNKFLAKIASDMNKPDGLTIVPEAPADIKAFLAPLPVGRLWGVGKVTQHQLERAGIWIINDVQQTSIEDLARQVGQGNAVFFKQLAEGIDDRLVETEHAEQSISREYTFDVDVQNRTKVREVLIDLVEDVGSQLRELGTYAGGIQIKLRWKGFETITRQRKLDSQVADDFSLSEAALQLFEKEKLVKPVRLVGFGVYALSDIPGGQMTLFDGPSRHKREKVSQTVDSIRRKFGKKSIGRGR